MISRASDRSVLGKIWLSLRQMTAGWVVILLTVIAGIMLGVQAGVTQLANAIVLGGMWALMGAGLALMFGVMNVSNFAHGEAFMLGSYLAYFTFTPIRDYLLASGASPILIHLAPFLGFAASLATGAVAGLIIETVVLRPLRSRTERNWIMNAFLVTAGLSFIMANGARLVFGSQFRGLVAYWDIPVIEALGGRLPVDRLASFLLACVSTAGLWWFLQRTDTGRAVRAVSQDEAGARMVGIRVRRIYSLTFGLATAMAALAGGSLLFMFPASPIVGQRPLYYSWYVLMLVGMGNVGGAIVGGFIVAVMQTTTQYFLGAMWEDVVPLLAMVFVLIVAPSGIFGSEVKGVHEK